MPPGAGNRDDFNRRCTGCGICIANCTGHTLKPAFLEYGLAGVGQPRLSFEIGKCEYECSKCSDLCPTGALRKLSAEEKRRCRIGEVHYYREISSYHRVAILLCDPPDISAERFFDRGDPEKKFILDEIGKCPDPQATLKNFRSWMRYHPPEETNWAHTGFFTYTRSEFDADTREEMLSALAKHFGLER